MNINNSKINLVAYQGENLPLYEIKGKIDQGNISAEITGEGKTFGDITGQIRESGFFFY